MKSTRLDVYVKGVKVYSYGASEGDFTANDVEIRVTNSNYFGE